MRNLIISIIKNDGWLDYNWDHCSPMDSWQDYQNRKRDPVAYAKWLETLDDGDLLAAYDRVREAEMRLD